MKMASLNCHPLKLLNNALSIQNRVRCSSFLTITQHGQLFSKETLIEYTKLCVKHNLWIISDEAYRELAYEKGKKHLVSGL